MKIIYNNIYNMELDIDRSYTPRDVATHFIKTPRGKKLTNYLNVLNLIKFGKLRAKNHNPSGSRPFYTIKGSAIQKYLDSQN
jgi:hypothetical protein